MSEDTIGNKLHYLTIFEQIEKKGQANGYAPLDANAKVPTVNLGGEGADNTKFLRGDQTWQVPPGGGGGTPSDTVTAETSFGQSPSAGSATAYSRGDHTHGTPADPVPAHAALTTGIHGVGTSNIESTAGSQSKVDTHASQTTGVHGVGLSSVESTSGSQAKVDAHAALTSAHSAVSTATADRIIIRDSAGRAAVADPSASSDIDTKGARDNAISSHAGLATGVHGVGASTVDSVAARDSAISSHAALTTNVHGFDASGNAPPQTHGSAKHSGTIGTWAQIDKTTSNIADIATRSHTSLSDIGTSTHATIDAHLAASAPHSGHLQIGGQIGGTPTSPDVRGLRETGGPTNLTMGAVADGQYLKRSGTTIVGDTPAGGGESEIIVVKSADTANSTTNLIDATELTFNADANSTYIIEVFLLWDTSATTVGIKVSASATGSPAINAGFFVCDAAAGTPDSSSYNANDVVTTTSASPFTTYNFGILHGILKTGASASTWVLRFAAETTGTITIKAGSVLRYRKVA
jgi:hypothetical protein